jgi:hypothetical protein
MSVLLVLAGALVMPVGAFAFLMWLAYLEDTLPADVRRAQRKPAPPPILAIPVRTPQAEPQTVVIPEQRPVPAAEVAPELSGPGPAVAV